MPPSSSWSFFCVRAVSHLKCTKVLFFLLLFVWLRNRVSFHPVGTVNKVSTLSDHHLLVLCYLKPQSFLSVKLLLCVCCCSLQLHNSATCMVEGLLIGSADAVVDVNERYKISTEKWSEKKKMYSRAVKKNNSKHSYKYVNILNMNISQQNFLCHCWYL